MVLMGIIVILQYGVDGNHCDLQYGVDGNHLQYGVDHCDLQYGVDGNQ